MKRRLLIATAFLLAGAVVNVAVAWGIALTGVGTLALRRVGTTWPPAPDHEGLYHDLSRGVYWWCQVMEDVGHTLVVYELACTMKLDRRDSAPRLDSGEQVVTLHAHLYDVWRSRQAPLQSFIDQKSELEASLRAFKQMMKSADFGNADVHIVEDGNQTRVHIPESDPPDIDVAAIPPWAANPRTIPFRAQIRSAFGWPGRSMFFDAALNWGWTKPTFEGGGRPSAARSFLPTAANVLPYRIIASGFALNTLFYAVLLWLVICGPFTLRRFIRLRRGLCPACAYPMGAAARCTECGWALPRRGVAGAA